MCLRNMHYARLRKCFKLSYFYFYVFLLRNCSRLANADINLNAVPLMSTEAWTNMRIFICLMKGPFVHKTNTDIIKKDHGRKCLPYL